MLQRFYRSTWLGFRQWADCRIGIGKKGCAFFQTCKLSLKFVVFSFGFIFFEVLEVPTHLVGFLLNANVYLKKKRPNPKVPPQHKTKNRLRHSYGILKHRPCPSVSAENFLGNFSGVVTGKPVFPPHFKGDFSMEPKHGSHEMFEFIQTKSWLGFTFKAGGYRSETWPTCEETASLGVCKIRDGGHPNSLATCELDTFHL